MGEAFWSWAVVAGLTINLITSALFWVLMLADRAAAALFIGYGLSLPYNVITVVGVWRAADRYTGEAYWGNLARIIVVIGMVFLSIS